MNKVFIIGRLVGDPEVRYSNDMAIARYTMAVDRKFKKEGQPEADFIRCTAFAKAAEFAEKYLKKGIKIAVLGRIQTDSYEKDGKKVYTTDVIVEEQEFCEKKGEISIDTSKSSKDGFMPIPDGIDLEELPFA